MKAKQQLALSLTKVNDRTPVGFSEGSGSEYSNSYFTHAFFAC